MTPLRLDSRDHVVLNISFHNGESSEGQTGDQESWGGRTGVRGHESHSFCVQFPFPAPSTWLAPE